MGHSVAIFSSVGGTQIESLTNVGPDLWHQSHTVLFLLEHKLPIIKKTILEISFSDSLSRNKFEIYLKIAVD